MANTKRVEAASMQNNDSDDQSSSGLSSPPSPIINPNEPQVEVQRRQLRSATAAARALIREPSSSPDRDDGSHNQLQRPPLSGNNQRRTDAENQRILSDIVREWEALESPELPVSSFLSAGAPTYTHPELPMPNFNMPAQGFSNRNERPAANDPSYNEDRDSPPAPPNRPPEPAPLNPWAGPRNRSWIDSDLGLDHTPTRFMYSHDEVDGDSRAAYIVTVSYNAVPPEMTPALARAHALNAREKLLNWEAWERGELETLPRPVEEEDDDSDDAAKYERRRTGPPGPLDGGQDEPDPEDEGGRSQRVGDWAEGVANAADEASGGSDVESDSDLHRADSDPEDYDDFDDPHGQRDSGAGDEEGSEEEDESDSGDGEEDKTDEESQKSEDDENDEDEGEDQGGDQSDGGGNDGDREDYDGDDEDDGGDQGDDGRDWSVEPDDSGHHARPTHGFGSGPDCDKENVDPGWDLPESDNIVVRQVTRLITAFITGEDLFHALISSDYKSHESSHSDYAPGIVSIVTNNDDGDGINTHATIAEPKKHRYSLRPRRSESPPRSALEAFFDVPDKPASDSHHSQTEIIQPEGEPGPELLTDHHELVFGRWGEQIRERVPFNLNNPYGTTPEPENEIKQAKRLKKTRPADEAARPDDSVDKTAFSESPTVKDKTASQKRLCETKRKRRAPESPSTADRRAEKKLFLGV